MDMAEYLTIVQQLAGGMLATLKIFLLTLMFSMPLGLLVAGGRLSKWAPFGFLMRKDEKGEGFPSVIAKFRPIQALTKVYISVVRGTPLMLQLLVVYFAPYYLFRINLTQEYRMVALLVGFSVNYAAYFAEIYRGGIESIPVGQYEAAAVLGYNKSQTFFKIVFPQMIKRILPSVTNEVITLVKDTAMAFVLTYTEIFTLAKQIAAAKTSIVPLFIAGVFYFVFNAIVAFVMEKVEKSLSYYK